MKDPFPLPAIPALSDAVKPYADRLNVRGLPFHVHEVVVFALFYTFVQTVVSPIVSKALFPRFYPTDRAKKANWDSHVVSLVQSVAINCVALYVIFFDEERKAMDWQQRIWGYTGASALVGSMAAGYFLWDFIMTVTHLDIFGVGLLAHAVSALTVYSFGFRPFLNFYAPVFILYELSTPFLNVHWFCDKLNLTGSKIQLYNGIALLATFACCRLVYGSFQSIMVYIDMWKAIHTGPDASYVAAAFDKNGTMTDPNANMMAFVTNAEPIPVWLAGIYLASNLVLNTLNWHWFFKMISAVRKRFEPAKKEKEVPLSAQGVAQESATTTAIETFQDARKRRNTLEDLTPDSEELREGTIQ